MTQRDIKLARLAELVGIDNMSNIEKLHRLLNSYDRLQEYYCNGRGYWKGLDVSSYDYDDENSKLFIAEKKHEQKIIDLVKTINPALAVQFQGDPRGYCVKIYRNDEDASKYRDCLSWLFYY